MFGGYFYATELTYNLTHAEKATRTLPYNYVLVLHVYMCIAVEYLAAADHWQAGASQPSCATGTIFLYTV